MTFLRNLALVLPFAVGVAHAQGLQAVRPLPGYECMALNLSQQDMMTETVPILVATVVRCGRNRNRIRDRDCGRCATTRRAIKRFFALMASLDGCRRSS